METKAGSADAFKLRLEGDEVVIDFGRIVDPANGSTAVNMSDRVVLSADAGRRLVHLLEEAVRPHAARLRAAEAQALSPAAAAAALRPGTPSQAAADKASDAAALLLRLVGDLGVPYTYERSLRMSRRGLSANRFLLSTNAKDLAGERRKLPLEICERLGMPGALRVAAEQNLSMAKCLHFGFEGEADSIICKLYLEREVPQEEALSARQRGDAVLLHLAFKWDLLTGAAVTTRYLWHPALSAPQIEERLRQVYPEGASVSFAIAAAALHLAREKLRPELLQYLEVLEDENARRSFDLNLYNAQLQVKDLQHLLHRMREHFALRPGQFQALYDQIKTKALGHIAGGVHRNGEDFFNLYYGAVGLPHFHAAFR
jgi:tryptophan halogenase